MKLFDSGRAPNPRRVRIFLAEKGITLPREQIEQIDIMKLEQKDPGFTERNPMQQVPVLILDDGTALSESVAICRYFEEIHPDPPLMGRDARDRAMVEMWNRRMELGLLYRVAQCVRHTHPALAVMEQPQVPAWGELNRGRVGDMMRLIDERLEHTAFIAGDAYTIADITALCALDFMRLAKIERPASLTHLARWYEAVSMRPSAKA